MPDKAKRRRKLTNITVKEISAVGEPAQEGAKITFLKSADGGEGEELAKTAYLLSTDEGHTHLLTDDYGEGERSNGFTTGADMANAGSYYSYHSHPWIRTEDGGIVIGTAMNHNHTVETVGKGAKEMDLKDAKPDAATAELVKGLQEKLEVLTAESGFTDAQRTFYEDLDEAGKTAFRKAGSNERDELIAKAAQKAAEAEEIYKARDGTIYKRSDLGVAGMALAKQVDQLQARTERAEAMAKAEREDAEVRKMVLTEFAHLPGTDDHKVALVKAARGIENEDARKAALDTLKSRDEQIAELGKAVGTNAAPSLSPDSPEARLEKMEKEWAEKNNKPIHQASDWLAVHNETYKALYGEAHG